MPGISSFPLFTLTGFSLAFFLSHSLGCFVGCFCHLSISFGFFPCCCCSLSNALFSGVPTNSHWQSILLWHSNAIFPKHHHFVTHTSTQTHTQTHRCRSKLRNSTTNKCHRLHQCITYFSCACNCSSYRCSSPARHSGTHHLSSSAFIYYNIALIIWWVYKSCSMLGIIVGFTVLHKSNRNASRQTSTHAGWYVLVYLWPVIKREQTNYLSQLVFPLFLFSSIVCVGSFIFSKKEREKKHTEWYSRIQKRHRGRGRDSERGR